MDRTLHEHHYDDALTQIGQAATRQALLAALSKAAASMGFDHAALQFAPSRLKSAPSVHVSTYSAAWLDECLRLPIATIARDPVLKHLGASVHPIVWGACNYRSASMDSVYELIQGYGLGSGISVAIRGTQGDYAYLGFSSTAQRVSSRACLVRELGALMLGASAAFVAIERIESSETNKSPVHLTQREIELLSWSRAGKTAQDCSQILGISQATVHFHLKNAVAKLDAASKQHAVLKALEMRLIH
jgi:LuxR family transcriptional regulator, quorum-sensing system regulator LasR